MDEWAGLAVVSLTSLDTGLKANKYELINIYLFWTQGYSRKLNVVQSVVSFPETKIRHHLVASLRAHIKEPNRHSKGT